MKFQTHLAIGIELVAENYQDKLWIAEYLKNITEKVFQNSVIIGMGGREVFYDDAMEDIEDIEGIQKLDGLIIYSDTVKWPKQKSLK